MGRLPLSDHMSFCRRHRKNYVFQFALEQLQSTVFYRACEKYFPMSLAVGTVNAEGTVNICAPRLERSL